MTYIISDLHSNIKELKKLLNLINLRKSDKLIFLGDYINKNIHTQETLQLLEELIQKYNCILIKGNHEFVWDRYLNGQELFRQEFLLNHGGVNALKQFSRKPEELIKNNKLELIKKYLKTYLKLIPKMADYFIVNDCIAIHAGLTENQMQQKPLKLGELNYFLRQDKINTSKKYLNKYKIVAGHTHFNTKPTIKKGYINIDLGAGYDGYLGALCVEKNIILRSDNQIFNYHEK